MKSFYKTTFFLLTPLLIAGCCDKYKKQIDQLTLEKRDLEAQLKRVQSDLDSKQLELVNCHDELAKLKDKVTLLESELQEAKKKPKLPSGWQMKKGMAMTSIKDTILFDPGKAILKSQARSKLNKILQQIKTNFPNQDIYIIGHTDSDPIRKSKWKDNLELSLHRSAAVARYLIKQGLNPKRIIVAGVGKYRPLVPNTTPANKATNRRVEFWILKPIQ